MIFNHLVSRLIQLVVSLAEIILLLRILLRLFAANPNASFVNWVYNTSSSLLEPFRGIFHSEVVGKSYVIDFNALFALIVYALLGGLVTYVAVTLEKAVMPSHTNTKIK